MRYALCVLLLCTACVYRAAPMTVAPFPALPDTVYTASGSTPVILVDSIPTERPGQTIVGQYWFLENRVLISRIVRSDKQKRRVVEHERCHIVLHESGLMMALVALPTGVVELLCDAFANAALAELERQPRR